jgi:hypothetical protein
MMLLRRSISLSPYHRYPFSAIKLGFNKAKWVEIMIAAGLSKEDMMKWHQKFEEMEPEEHQKFLESLEMTQDEITAIRSL